MDMPTMRLSASTTPYKGADHTAVASPVSGDYTIEPSGVWHYNGTEWIRDSDPQVIQGGGSALYFTSIANGAGFEELSPTPDFSTVDEENIALPTANTPVFLGHQYKAVGAIGAANVPAGQWGFRIYAKADSANHQTTLQFDIGTIDVLDVVTWHFSAVSPPITTTTLSDYSFISVQPALVNTATDKMVVRVSAISNTNNTSVTWTHSSSTAYSCITPPQLPVLHDNLGGLNVGDYKHLTAAKVAALDDLIAGGSTSSTELFDFTTDSDLTAGQKVVLKSSGHVEAVVSTLVTGVIDSSTAANSSGSAVYLSIAYNTADKKYLLIYTVSSSSYYKIGTPSTGGKPITWGSETLIFSSVSGNAVVYDELNNKFILAYINATTNKASYTIGTPVAGMTSISWLSSQVLSTFDATMPALVINGSSIVFIARNGGNGGYLYQKIGAINSGGSVITWSSEVQINNINSGSPSMCFIGSKLILLFSNYTTALLTSMAGELSGGSVSWGNPVATAYDSYGCAITYDSVTQKIVAFCKKNSNNFSYYFTITEQNFTLSYSASVELNNADSNHLALTLDKDNLVFTAVYQNPAVSSSVYYKTFTIDRSVSNYLDYIGISQSTAATNATVSVRVNGVDSLQSGLTPNTKYYLQADGSISATVSSVYFGKSLAATKVLLNPAV